MFTDQVLATRNRQCYLPENRNGTLSLETLYVLVRLIEKRNLGKRYPSQVTLDKRLTSLENTKLHLGVAGRFSHCEQLRFDK